MKVFEIVLNDNDETLGIETNSIVNDPAVEINFLKFKDNKPLYFANDEKRIISGIAILCSTPIYRRDSFGEYFVNFSPDVTRRLVEKFMREKKQNLINLEHETEPNENDATLIESFFINHSRGIVPNEFQDVTDGSWYVSYKINNDELWNKIKNSELEEQNWLDEYL
mgnify:CR=1 FL=1